MHSKKMLVQMTGWKCSAALTAIEIHVRNIVGVTSAITNVV